MGASLLALAKSIYYKGFGVVTGTDRVLSWNTHSFSGFRILSKRHQVRATMYEITKNFLTSL